MPFHPLNTPLISATKYYRIIQADIPRLLLATCNSVKCGRLVILTINSLLEAETVISIHNAV